MERLKSIFKSKDVTDALNAFNTVIEITKERTDIAITRVFENEIQRPSIKLGDTVIADLDLIESGVTWIAINKTETKGGAVFLRKLIEKPSTDLKLLEKRKASCLYIRTQRTIPGLLKRLKNMEGSVLWTINVPNLKKEQPLPMLFPSWNVLSPINSNSQLLDLYHLYKTVISPSLTLVAPLSTILGPYYYLKFKLKFNLTLFGYLKFVFSTVYQLMFLGGFSLWKLVICMIYFGLYVYGIIVSVELFQMVKTVRASLHKKIVEIVAFIKVAQIIIHDIPDSVISPFTDSNSLKLAKQPITIKETISDVYNLWTDSKKREQVLAILKIVYVIDAITSIVYHLNKRAVPVTFTTKGESRLYGVTHPAIKTPVSNPISLRRSLIVTGPNAGGKSTYVKAVMLNILLSQSLGISFAINAKIRPVHAIYSYMRIWDSPGDESLFQAEVSRCNTILSIAEQCKDSSQRAIFFLDEPMHSTPPLEGAAVAQAVVKRLGKLKGNKVVVTTHFHSIADLENSDKSHFVNISMEAKVNEKNIIFPYKLNRGLSRQCIAIDLLRGVLPDEVIDDALIILKK